ncbi:MAG: hypothetical protein QHH75_12685 [Bacillota bacterium]|jgi:hypothetical protein|nr:hypothetical protein [Bacillota bacterium]
MVFQQDEITLIIAGVTIKVRRLHSLPVPHEVTVVIPRAEIRHRRYREGKLIEEDEAILNSITIVHAPRHPPGGAGAPVSKGGVKNDSSSTTWKFTFSKK